MQVNKMSATGVAPKNVWLKTLQIITISVLDGSLGITGENHNEKQ